MTSDQEFLMERRRADDRVALIRSADPEIAPRLAPAVAALKEHLAGRGWCRHDATLAAGVRASDLAVRTVDNLLRRAVLAGLIEKRGEYVRGSRGRKAIDTRAYRLIGWPDSEN